MPRVCRAQSSGGKKSTAKTAKAAPKPAAPAGEASADANNSTNDPITSSASAVGTDASSDAIPDPREKKGRSKGDCLYYRVKCKDNGVGMPHDKVGLRLSKDRWSGVSSAFAAMPSPFAAALWLWIF